jgi:hypothetical protein
MTLAILSSACQIKSSSRAACDASASRGGGGSPGAPVGI